MNFRRKYLLLLLLPLASCAQNPKTNELEFQQAYDAYTKADLVASENILHQYVKEYPDDYKGWSLLGAIASDSRNDSLATIYVSKALSLNPEDYMALTEAGALERRKKNYNKAEQYYNKAISIAPTYSRAYGSLLIIELKKGNYSKAVELGEKATILEPDDLNQKGNLAIAYHFAKQFDKRDSLIELLKGKGYPYIDNLKGLFKANNLDDL